ncbi:Uu.00g015480.m01.CDS01 [Anthostomella pinea]|uniref:Uu.00g015480.m01.CDS01 n=1 Tax=Anthostomella pinea TaxID=933095 RepID=A0AAI8YQB7_9PEZI|nr:Uu.00g015480.m01.CDS01 [Anthostomella pinea]
MSLEGLEKRFTDLQDRLTVLQDATNQLKDLIERLANFNFQPGSVPLGASEDDNVGTELSSEINQILREQEEELELLHEEIIDIRLGKSGSEVQHDKDRLKDGAQRLEQELASCRKSFRKAQISAKRNLQLAQRQERELLYASFASPRSGASSPIPAAPLQRRKQQVHHEMSKEEQMISAGNDVTQSMRRTHEMMSTELAKSDYAHNALKDSTAALAQLSDNYSNLDTMLSNSKSLVTTLFKSQKSDTWYLRSAFYLLVVTIAWLAWRRLLWGPTWWMVWLPLKLLFRSAVGISNAVGLSGPRGNPESSSALDQSGLHQVQMNNEGVPTIQVGDQPPVQSQGSKDEDSMVEQVGKVIDAFNSDNPLHEDQAVLESDAKEKDTVLRERNAEELPNPKKRMMEEEPGGTRPESDQRVRDEL